MWDFQAIRVWSPEGDVSKIFLLDSGLCRNLVSESCQKHWAIQDSHYGMTTNHIFHLFKPCHIWYWLVVWNIFFIVPFSWECHHPNWRSPSFFRWLGLNHQPGYMIINHDSFWYSCNAGMNLNLPAIYKWHPWWRVLGFPSRLGLDSFIG